MDESTERRVRIQIPGVIYLGDLGGVVYAAPASLVHGTVFVYSRDDDGKVRRLHLPLAILATLDPREATEGERVGFLIDMLPDVVRTNALALVRESCDDLIEAADGLDDERADALRWLRSYFLNR